MDRSTALITGLFGSFAVSSFLMLLVPQAQLGALQPQAVAEEGQPGRYSDIYPARNDATGQGRAVYIQEGCIYCHSQQVRDPHLGSDLARGWGARRTVARDYLYESPALLGSQRLGPDLSNVGSPDWRNENKDDLKKPAKRDSAWHYLHLYAPRVVHQESNHPSYRYLFDERKIAGQRSVEALNLASDQVEAGMEVVPGPAAKALITYLRSLDRTHELAEAKGPAGPATAATAPAAK